MAENKLIIAALFSGLALAGCDPVPVSDTVTAAGTERDLPILTDPMTGCDYIAPTGYRSDGMMPRISSDGFTVFCAEQKRALSSATQPGEV